VLHKLHYDQIHEIILFLIGHCFNFFHEVSREYVGMFLHLIGVSLWLPFNLLSNVWHVEIMMWSVIGDVSMISALIMTMILTLFVLKSL